MRRKSALVDSRLHQVLDHWSYSIPLLRKRRANMVDEYKPRLHQSDIRTLVPRSEGRTAKLPSVVQLQKSSLDPYPFSIYLKSDDSSLRHKSSQELLLLQRLEWSHLADTEKGAMITQCVAVALGEGFAYVCQGFRPRLNPASYSFFTRAAWF